MTKILIKRGQAEANLPTLDPGEPAITFDSGGKLWIGTPSGNREITGGGSSSPGGSDTQVQFNDGGSFGGSANFTWDGTANQLLVGGATAVSADSVLEVHDSYVNTILMLANDTASAELNTTAMGFYLKNSAEAQEPFAGFEVGSVDRTNGSEDGYFTIAVMLGGTSTPLFRLESTAINLNYLGRDTDTIIQGDTATKLGVFDAGLEAFQIGTNVAGAIADFRSTAIVLNNAEADVDIRWGGNGVTNGVYFDAGNIRLGVNTVPSTALHVVEDSGTVAIFEENASGEVGINSFYNPNTTDNNGSLIRFDTDTTGTGATARSQIAQIGVVFTTHNHTTRTGNIVFRNYQSGAFGTRVTIGSGIQVGSPTGGDKGSGTANFAGDIYKNNTAYTNPDYALEHWVTGEVKKFANRSGSEGYYRLSIDESEKFVKENLHLPRISRDSAGIFDMADMALEKIEEAHIYIYELNYRIKRLEKLLDLN